MGDWTIRKWGVISANPAEIIAKPRLTVYAPCFKYMRTMDVSPSDNGQPV